jgi:hypothetical protein
MFKSLNAEFIKYIFIFNFLTHVFRITTHISIFLTIGPQEGEWVLFVGFGINVHEGTNVFHLFLA